MEFAERLKMIRKECNLTQKDVYTKLNISANGYASYEQGRTEPNIETIIKLCKIFNISSDYLLGIDEDIPQNGTKTSGTVNNTVNINFKN